MALFCGSLVFKASQQIILISFIFLKTVFGKSARVKEGAHADEIRLDDTVLSNYLFYFVRGREITKFYKKSFLHHLKNSRISTKTLAKRRTHEFCFLCTTLETQS